MYMYWDIIMFTCLYVYGRMQRPKGYDLFLLSSIVYLICIMNIYTGTFLNSFKAKRLNVMLSILPYEKKHIGNTLLYILGTLYIH